MDFLLAPFHYDFFMRGLLASVLAGALCALMGVYIVLRRMSYVGHGLSHAILGGAVVSYVMQIDFYLGAGGFGVLAALLINAVTKKRHIGADAAIGVVTTACFAIGVVLISRARRFTTNFEAALFGDILGVTARDLFILAGVLVFVVAMIFVHYKQLLFLTFDREVAPTYGIDTSRLDFLFALMLSATIIGCMQVLGVTLISAAIVIPAVVARLLTDRFSSLLFLSTALGAVCGLVGMFVSYYLDAASGATIVLVAALLFVVTLGASQLRAARGERVAAARTQSLAAWVDEI